jgi:cytochrome c oxidase cbb3-type subunit 4
MMSGLITLALTLLFLAVFAWAWRDARRGDFDDAARLPLDDPTEDRLP